MIHEFLLYVPGNYQFENYFLPKLFKPTIETFEVSYKRRGIQRKGNNHLTVFLDFEFKRTVAQYAMIHDGEAGELFLETASHREFFNQVFKDQKEVSTFSLTYDAKMSVLAWECMVEIADDPQIIVKDVSSELMRGDDLALELKELLNR